MNNFNNLLIHDNIDKALDYITPSSLPSILADGYKSTILKLFNNEKDIIDHANRFIVRSKFDEVYRDLILEYSSIAGEDISIWTVPYTMVGKMLSIKNCSNLMPFGDYANIVDDYTWLYIRNIKNDRFGKYLSEYLHTLRYISNNNQIFIPILPAENFDVLDEIVRAMFAYL